MKTKTIFEKTRWVFTFKYNLDGMIDRYKIRLIAKGFTQAYGVVYFELRIVNSG